MGAKGIPHRIKRTHHSSIPFSARSQFPAFLILLFCLNQMPPLDKVAKSSVMAFVLPNGAFSFRSAWNKNNQVADPLERRAFWKHAFLKRRRILSMSENGPFFYDDFESFNTNDRNEREEPDEDDDEDEDEEDILASNDQMLGDWRSFRRKLAANERKSDSSTNDDAIPQSATNALSNSRNASNIQSTDTSTTTVTTRNPKSPNELLLAQQNEKLALEYHNDVWAHEIATVRVCTTRTSPFFIYIVRTDTFRRSR